MARSIFLDLSDDEFARGAQSLLESGRSAFIGCDYQMARILLTVAKTLWEDLGHEGNAAEARALLD